MVNHPTPNFDILPICDREITITRPDPETECINVHLEVSISFNISSDSLHSNLTLSLNMFGDVFLKIEISYQMNI